jgi:hypothetical protein
VTEYGIEAVDGSYPIKKDVLLENLHDRSWLLQMGEKVWVDMNEFATAFMVALVMHGYSPADANVLKRQLDSVEKERKGDLGGDDN